MKTRLLGIGLILMVISLCGCDDSDSSSGPPNVSGTWANSTSASIYDFVQADYNIQGVCYDQFGSHPVSGRVFDGGGITFTTTYSFGSNSATGEVNGNRMDLTWTFQGETFVFPLFRK